MIGDSIFHTHGNCPVTVRMSVNDNYSPLAGLTLQEPPRWVTLKTPRYGLHQTTLTCPLKHSALVANLSPSIKLFLGDLRNAISQSGLRGFLAEELEPARSGQDHSFPYARSLSRSREHGFVL